MEDLEMRTNFDFTPYRRTTVGFDRLFEMLESGLLGEAADGYPPFDIVKEEEDRYRITLALAGFRPDEVEITARQDQLVIAGRKAERQDDDTYVYRGIATRSFERRFQLADFVEVRGADFENGLLSIHLQQVFPEEMKPRKIVINSHASAQGGGAPQLTSNRAA